jgi:hypothetical protein
MITGWTDAPKVYNAPDPTAPECTTFPFPVGGQTYPDNVVYLIVRTWTAIDACGNQSTYEQNVWVVDTIAPRFSRLTPAEVWVECGDAVSSPQAVTTPNDEGSTQIPASLDNPAPLHAVLSVTDAVISGAVGDCSYTIERVWTAKDQGCNEVTFTQLIHVTDSLGPEITPLGSITLEFGESTDPSNTGTPTATDACVGSVPVTIDSEVVEVLDHPGFDRRIYRTWKAEDPCGNASTMLQVITVLAEPPTMNLTITPSLSFNDVLELSFPTVEGYAYTLQGCADAEQQQWLNVTGSMPGTGEEMVVPMSVEGVKACMFRVQAVRQQ